MKTTICNRFVLVFALTLMIMPMSKAQVKNLGQMMAAGTNDAQKLFQAYLSPYVDGFGAAMAGGWYNTAEAHKPGGFEITFTLNAAMVPDEFTTFDIDELNLQLLKLPSNSTGNNAPTIAGPSDDGPQLNYNSDEFELKAFDMPQGLDWRYVPAPTIQAGVGLFKGTDLLGRYLPNIKAGGAEFGMWGIGGRHDIKQWIPGVKKLPILELSLMYGYTKLHANVGLSVTPSNIHADDNTTDISWENQKLNFIAQSHTANLLVAAKLKVITFYGGAGIIQTKSNLKLKGYYPVADFSSLTGTELVVTNESAALDPVNMVFENKDGNLRNPRLNIGFRLKMSIITINFDYTRAIYNVFTAGFGVSWR